MFKRPPPPFALLRGHEGAITALHFTNEENAGLTANPSLISASDIGEIFIWNLKTNRSYCRIKGHSGKMILYVCFYESSLISQGRDDFIHFWKFVDNRWSIIRTIKAPNFGFCTAKLFPTSNCTYFITPSEEGSSINFYDYKTVNVLYNFKYRSLSENFRETCMCIKVIQMDIKLYLIMGFDSGDIVLWNYDMKEEKSRFKIHPDAVFCLDYDTKYKNKGISGSADNILKVWKIEDDQLTEVKQITITNSGISTVKIRDDGKIVITGGQDYVIRVFSWKSLKPLAVLQFHTSQISVLQFCSEPFHKYRSVFASGSKDKNICLWSIY